MARKSRDLRLAHINEALGWYEELGLTNDRSARFLSDMKDRYERGRDLSSNQKKYADSLYDQGRPQVKNEEKVRTIKEAASLDGMQKYENTLNDFAFKISRDWTLSEKQNNFLESLMQKADDIRENGKWTPNQEDVQELQSAVNILKSQSRWAFQHRPGLGRSLDEAIQWLSGEEQVSKGLTDKNPHVIDEWVFNKVRSSCKGKLAELKSPKHEQGSMRFRRNGEVVLVLSDPRINSRGAIMYTCLMGSSECEVSSDNLLKRRPKV